MDTSPRTQPDTSTDTPTNNNDTVTTTETEQQQQNRIITSLIPNYSPLQEGNQYYLIPIHWWNTWKNWSGYVGSERWRNDTSYYSSSSSSYQERDRPKPGPIDNSVLLDESEGSDVVRKGKSDYDFSILIPEVWEKLVEWYGGGPPICRPCIRQSPAYQASLIVEVRKLKLKIIYSKKPKEPFEKWYSRACSIGEFVDTMCEELHFDKTKIRVYDFHNARKLKLLDKLEKHMDESQILDGQYVLIEEQKKNGQWPNEKIYKRYVQQTQSYYPRTPTPAGQTGLSNLGNTCFMNSGLQCLSATTPIVDFFLSKKYEKEINHTNPLGMRGEVAKAYANMLIELWSTRTSVVVPRDLKNVISKYAPQFTGYAQHDSHELLAFVLDGLHEDLNRIQQKPYVEQKDSNGRLDDEVSKEAWEGHKARNDSVIVDLFQGQLKSRLKCPVNGRVSNQFDPFMYLSVPIPIKNTKRLVLDYYPKDLTVPPKKYGVEVNKFGSVWDLKVKLGSIVEAVPQSLVVLDVFCSRFHREFKNHEDVSDIRDNDTVAVYEVVYSFEDIPRVVSSKSMNTQAEQIPPTHNRLHVLVREEETSSYNRTFIGVPFVVSVEMKVTYRELYNLILNYMIIRNHLKSTARDYTGDLFKIFSQSQYYYQNQVKSIFQDNDQPLDFTDRDTVVLELKKSDRFEYYEGEPAGGFQIDVDASAKTRADASSKDSLSLYDCLSLFSSEEQLGAEDAWYCPECKDFRQAHKKFDIWKAPKILVFQLKRFSQVNRAWRERLDNLIRFPLDNLDLSQYVIGPTNDTPPIYDLYAVSNHYGSMGGGHYTAYARHRDNNKWYKYDDSSVSEATPSEIVSTAAYVLFYRRKDVDWPAFNPAFDQVPASDGEADDDDDDDDDDSEDSDKLKNGISSMVVSTQQPPAASSE